MLLTGSFTVKIPGLLREDCRFDAFVFASGLRFWYLGGNRYRGD